MNKKNWKFDEWFTAQFGDPMNGCPKDLMHATDEDLVEITKDGYRAQIELQRRNTWEAKKDAALKAFFVNS